MSICSTAFSKVGLFTSDGTSAFKGSGKAPKGRTDQPCAPQEVHTHINSATFASDADVTLLSSSRNLKVSSPTVYAQDRTAPPITAFYPSFTAGQRIQFLWLALSSRAELSAEVLFLRKQLAFYREHQVPPRRLTDAARFSLVLWSQLFNWRAALMIVKPETLIGWHRKGFKMSWRRKSRLGRPRSPKNLRQLIVRMVQENPTGARSASQPNFR